MDMKHISSKILVLVMLTMMGVRTMAATTVTIPTADGSYIGWNNADVVSANVENGGANVGSTGSKTVITFVVQNETQQDYILSFQTGSKYAATMDVTVTDEGNNAVLNKNVAIENTGSWNLTSSHNLLLPNLPVGTYTLKLAVASTTGSYAGNWGNLAFRTTGNYDNIPGTISLAKGSYNGPKVEGAGNVGYVQNGGTASYNLINSTAGAFNMLIDLYRCNGGTMGVVIKDSETGATEYTNNYVIATDAPAAYTTNTLPISNLTAGVKTMTFTFSNGSGYICNYQNLKFDYIGKLAEVSGVTIDGQTVTNADDNDWQCLLPMTYTAATTTLKVAASNGSVALTARDGQGNDVAVTSNADGSFTLATPAQGSSTIVTMALTAADGAVSEKSTYTIRLFHIGEITLKNITVDGTSMDVLNTINADPYSATISDNIYTAEPTVTATLIDGSAATVTGSLNGTTGIYTIYGTIGGKSRTFTLNVEGVNIYNKTANDKTVTLKYSSTGKTDDGNWTDGLYSISNVNDGWESSSFKLNKGDYTFTIPADVVVKQIIFRDFNANYNGGTLNSVTSDGATAVIPSKHNYEEPDASKYDLVINLKNHTAGKPITFNITGGGQPVAWFDFTVEQVAVTTAPVLKTQSVTSTDSRNHCMVALTFDREMKESTASIGGNTITADGGSSTLYFPVWDLNYNSDNTLTIPVGGAMDTHGNGNTEAINVNIKVGAKATVDKSVYDYVVSTATEFANALTAVKTSNGSSTAGRKVIFIKNGDYDFGTTEQTLAAYNVSFIGESRDGVILHGTRDGISNPIVNLKSYTGLYLQDLTVRNDKNYGASDKAGVAVAVSGGKKAIFKNVRMLSNQDTQVTGERAYFEDCDIHGTVDFICGGGDNFYWHTNLVLEDRSGDVIAAPSTSSLTKWGYVFQECTIKVMDGASQVVDGGYNLGRPWQNEPRIYYLNTKMEVLPSNNGWTAMGTLPTHFYEYKSVKADGTLIDLSVRGNSSTSTNTYTPVLTDEEASEYTLKNVLGGTDSWLPTEECLILPAPTVAQSDNILSWTAVDDARCYVIFRNGTYLQNQTATTYTITDDAAYTIRCSNLNGGLGTATDTSYTTGIVAVEDNALPISSTYYNLQGQRVGNSAKGVVVKVEKLSDGTVKTIKTVK